MSSRATAALVLVISTLLVLAGCAPEPAATRADCEAILNRIVALELQEMGFADPELQHRHQADLRQRFAGALSECVGRPLPKGAMACIAQADHTETVSHDCLH